MRDTICGSIHAETDRVSTCTCRPAMASESQTRRETSLPTAISCSFGSTTPRASRSVSRRSVTIALSRRAFAARLWISCLRSSSVMPSRSPSSRVSELPRIADRGVRMSCETAVRKAVLISSARRMSSMACRSRSSARVRSSFACLAWVTSSITPLPMDGGPVLVAEEHRFVTDPDGAAVGGDQSILTRVRLAGIIAPAPFREHPISVVRMQGSGPPVGVSRGDLGRVSEELLDEGTHGGRRRRLGTDGIDVGGGSLTSRAS